MERRRRRPYPGRDDCHCHKMNEVTRTPVTVPRPCLPSSLIMKLKHRNEYRSVVIKAYDIAFIFTTPVNVNVPRPTYISHRETVNVTHRGVVECSVCETAGKTPVISLVRVGRPRNTCELEKALHDVPGPCPYPYIPIQVCRLER